ncbi:ATP-binding protein [Streptomyces sp. NPDC049813]|uniref:ATP-binding protein n=1 Tax=Streptomyces sp. NPDC049813 TaxID=3365597 RepID=UPI0037BC348C
MASSQCVVREPWGLAFAAEPSELSALRRTTRMHLASWGLHHLSDAAELCVTELVANVIHHVGEGTPTSICLSMSGVFLRIEVEDPDLRVLPTLRKAADDSEAGRGMQIVSAVTERWGVLVRGHRKVTWCELHAGLESPGGHVAVPSVKRAAAVLAVYAESAPLRARAVPQASREHEAGREHAAISLIADLLGWVRAHGLDPNEVLKRAQIHL